MPKARFQSRIGSPVIDEANGVIKGCRIATLGAVSEAAKDQGKGMVMDSETISGLFRLSQEAGGKVPAFFTHDWFDDDKHDPLNYDAGVWDSFRVVDGNLIADFHAFETSHKAGIFSRAKIDPNSIAVSPIFDYEDRNGSKTLCTPTHLYSSDFVKQGAINRALFSEDQTNTTMPPIDIPALIAAIKDPEQGPHIVAAIKAAIKSVESAEPDDTSSEEEAGVTEADKKPEDDAKPAIMRSALRINRATARLAKSIKDDKATLLTEAEAAGAKGATALLGKGGFVKATTGDPAGKDEFDNAVQAELKAHPGISIGRAKFNLSRTNPELYAKHSLLSASN